MVLRIDSNILLASMYFSNRVNIGCSSSRLASAVSLACRADSNASRESSIRVHLQGSAHRGLYPCHDLVGDFSGELSPFEGVSLNLVRLMQLVVRFLPPLRVGFGRLHAADRHESTGQHRNEQPEEARAE